MKALLPRHVRLSLALIVVAGLLVAVPTIATAAPPRFFRDMSAATWTTHLTGGGGSAQGEAWLQKTPCGLGAFLQIKAPCVAGLATEERLVLREEGKPEVLLARVDASLPDFGIVIAYWPTGTPMFPDTPSPLYVQLEANRPFGAALPYDGTAAGSLPMQPADFFEALDSGDVWVDVVVDDDVVLAGRVAR